MVLEFLDWVLIIIFLAITFGIGIWLTHNADKNLEAFFLGGRKFPWYIAGISMVATTFAADTPLAVTELVHQNGIAGNWLWWNMLAGGMLTTFFFANLWRRAKVLTEVELIELRYSGKPAMWLRGFKAAYLGIFMNCLIIGWVNLALISLLEVFFGLSAEEALWYTAAAMAFVTVYASLSGLVGIAINDMVQFLIAMTGCIILAVIVVNSEEIGGIEALKSKLPLGTLNFFPSLSNGSAEQNLTGLSLSVGAFLAFATIQWWASWYPGAEPGGGGYIAQRMMSAKNEKHAVAATLFFQIAHYCIRPWPWILVALCSILLYPELSESDKKLGFVMAIKDYMPVGLKGLLLVGFFAAYMSTISTQLNFGASFVVNDLYHRFIYPKAGQRHLVHSSRITTLLLMGVGLFATTQMTTISGVWTFIIECGAGLGLVLILRWYWWRINAWSEITATFTPFVAYAVSRYVLDLEFPDSFFLTVGSTSAAWILVTLLTPPTNKQQLQRFYDRIKPDGFWQAVRSSEQGGSSRIMKLAICWISAVAFTYSILFLTGKILLQEWQQAGILTVTTIISFGILRTFIRQTRILSDE